MSTVGVTNPYSVTTTELRQSKQLYHRSLAWASNAEGVFWLLWIALIFVGGIVAGLINFFQGLLG